MTSHYLAAPLLALCLAACDQAAVPVEAEEPSPASANAEACCELSSQAEVEIAIEHWLQSLDPKQRTLATTPFTSDLRKDWHFVPRERAGVAFKDMTDIQREAAREVIEAGLSDYGLQRVDTIMALETILRDLGGDPVVRDPDNYAFMVFGIPGDYPWGWRIEGHHLSINVTSSSARDVVMTPTFMGSNPARYPSGPNAGDWVQSGEYGAGLALAQSLTEAQWAEAKVSSDPFGGIAAAPGKPDSTYTDRRGVAVAALDDAQQTELLNVITAFVDIANDDVRAAYMNLVQTSLPETYFSWAGGRDVGDPFYYRIQGPRILIEYDNSLDDGNHVHAVWRDPVNDFGDDALRRHLAKEH